VKFQYGNRFSFLILVFIIGLLLGSDACWGELAIPLQIENRTDKVITLYVQGVKIRNIEPNSSIKVKNVGMTDYYLIEAKNSTGEIIYSRRFSLPELHDADWKVVIPP
jgi:hypothetical protein